MQFEKDEIRQSIIAMARAEFLQSGFEKASIRKITRDAKTSKSNIYNYYKDKDDLFCRILEETVSKIREGLKAAEQYNVAKSVGAYTFESQAYVFRVIFRFVEENTDDIRLLLFKSQGSSLENFKHEILEAFTDNMRRWTQSFENGAHLTEFFVRSFCSFYLSIIEQALLYSNAEEIKASFGDLLTFLYSGWKNVLQNHERSPENGQEN